MKLDDATLQKISNSAHNFGRPLYNEVIIGGLRKARSEGFGLTMEQALQYLDCLVEQANEIRTEINARFTT